MTTIERLTDLNDAPVYTVRDNSAVPRGEIRHRWGLWTYEPTPHEIRAADADLARLTARLPRILGDTTMSEQPSTLTDAQYQQFLTAYDDTHEGLTWDQSENAFRVAPNSPWDDDDYEGVYRRDGGTWVSASAVNESLDQWLTEDGFTLELRNACFERLSQSNR